MAQAQTGQLIADIRAKLAESKDAEGNINKEKLYFSLYSIRPENYGIVDVKQSYKYISWTYAEMVLKILDSESDVRVVESTFPNMIKLQIEYLGKKYEAHYPILDSANQGAVVEKTFEIKELLKEETTYSKDSDGKIESTGKKIWKEQVVVEKDELVFWQSRTKSSPEGRKARVTAMNLNSSIQRATAKEISRITGFGLSIFTGEDLTQYG